MQNHVLYLEPPTSSSLVVRVSLILQTRNRYRQILDMLMSAELYLLLMKFALNCLAKI